MRSFSREIWSFTYSTLLVVKRSCKRRNEKMQMLCTRRLIKVAPPTRRCRWKIKLWLKSIKREREKIRETWMKKGKNGNRQTPLRWNEPRARILRKTRSRRSREVRGCWLDGIYGAQAGCRTLFLIMRSQKEDWVNKEAGKREGALSFPSRGEKTEHRNQLRVPL